MRAWKTTAALSHSIHSWAIDRCVRCALSCFGVLVLFGLKTSHCLSLEPSYPSIVLCANSSFEVTCNVSTSFVLTWTFVTYQGNTSKSPLFTTNSMLNESETVGDLVFKVISKSPLITKVTLEPIDPKHNGSILTCSSDTAPNPAPQDVASITILVKEPPPAPRRPDFIPLSLDSAVLSWTSPTDSSCITGYTITLTNITEGDVPYIFNTTTNTTNMTVSDLTQGAEYSFNVTGIDAGGRVGEESVPSNTVMLDTPEAVIMLQYKQSYVDDSLAKITLKWMPPPPSTRPPVIGYTVSLNSNKSVLMNETSDTEFDVEITVPNILMLTVFAVNALGIGEGNNITISIMKPIATESKDMLGTVPTEPTVPTELNNNDLLYQVIIPCVVVVVVLLAIVFILMSLFCMKKSGWTCAFKRVTEGSVLSLTETHKSGDISLYDTGKEAQDTFRPLPQEPMDDLDEYNEDNTSYKLSPPLPLPHTEGESAYSQLTGAHKQPQFLPYLEDSTYSRLNKSTQLPGLSHNQECQGIAQTSHYAELGERSRDAPIVLPPEQAVIYTMIKSSEANKGSTTNDIQHLSGGDLGHRRPDPSPEAAESQKDVPPPLPPKGELVHFDHVIF